MEKMTLAPMADEAAKKMNAQSSFDEVWDMCDAVSGGELDTVQMDNRLILFLRRFRL
jgi:hypothetical protein